MGKQWKQCQILFWGGSKITADGDCNHEIKRCLLLGRKVMTNLDSILKSRDITRSTKVHLVNSVLSVTHQVLLFETPLNHSTPGLPVHWVSDAGRVRVQFSSVQFSCSVLSDSLQPHESQHARPPCPSPTPGVHSNACPSSR